MSDASGEPRSAVVLDFLAHGRSDGARPQYERGTPIGYAVDTSDFTLYELEFEAGEGMTIGSSVTVDPAEARSPELASVTPVNYETLSSGARSELEYVVEDVVESDEERFVNFYNEAQPITLRLHQLNLLPGIGKKLRNAILDERKRKPFESFEELDERVTGLHDPSGVLIDRILEELRDEDLKYRIFVGRRPDAEE